MTLQVNTMQHCPQSRNDNFPQKLISCIIINVLGTYSKKKLSPAEATIKTCDFLYYRQRNLQTTILS